jgi:hypothetical protein
MMIADAVRRKRFLRVDDGVLPGSAIARNDSHNPGVSPLAPAMSDTRNQRSGR